MGIPNDERCLGFGDARFVYSHSVFGVETNRGILYLQKLGTGSRYALMAPQQTLSIFDHEVAHPIKEVTVAVDDQRVQWQAE